jgi:hypothetical protein
VFDLINGLPVHPLVVHAVVVLVPLAALGTIAIALRPAWRRTYGPPVAALAILGAVLCPVATSSGEALARRVGNPDRHAELGGQLVWFVVPLAVLALALVLRERRRPATGATAGAPGAGPGAASAVVTVVAALAVLAALATGFQAYRVGDSGANAVWGGLVPSSSDGGAVSDD